MKRLAALLLLLFTILSSVNSTTGDAMDAFIPFHPRSLGMGGTGVASARYAEVFYSNPALVGVDNQFFSLPLLSFTLYNVNKLVQPGGALDIFFTQDDPDRAFDQLVNSIGSGRGDVLSGQMSFGFISGITGLSIDTTLDVHSQGQGGEASTLVLEGNFAFSLAISVPFTVAGQHTFSFGAGAHLVFRGFSIQDMEGPVRVGGFSAGSILGFYDDEGAGRIRLRDTVGLRLHIRLAGGVHVRPGSQERQRGLPYADIQRGQPAVLHAHGRLSGVHPAGTGRTGRQLQLPHPDEPGCGIRAQDSRRRPVGLDRCHIRLDLFREGVSAEGFVSRMRTGIELSLMRTFDFRFGLNGGYMSFGFTFDFQIMSIDLTYATLEYGDRVGDKPLDLFSISFRIGLEN